MTTISLTYTPVGKSALDLNDGVNYLLLGDGLQNADMPPIANLTAQTPLRDYESYSRTQLKPRFLTFNLETRGVDWPSLETARRNLLAAFNPKLGVGVLNYGIDSTHYLLDCISEVGPLFKSRRGYTAYDTTINLRAPDPAWRAGGNQALIGPFGAFPASGLVVPIAVPLSLPAGSVTQNMTNAGDLDSYPVVSITGPSSSPTMTNNTTGKTCSFPGLVIPAGQTLNVDMKARTAVLNGVSVIGYRSAASQAWPLVPGVNSVTISVLVDPAGLSNVQVGWQTRLIGI